MVETKANKNADNIIVNANDKVINQLPVTDVFATYTSTGLNLWVRGFVPQRSTNRRNNYGTLKMRTHHCPKVNRMLVLWQVWGVVLGWLK